MVISDMLNDKSVPHPDHIVTCGEDEPVRSAVAKMQENKIGAVVVKAGERVAGVFSERDVVRIVQNEDADVLGTKLGEVMTRDVISIAPDQTVDDALVLMKENNIRHLTVMNGDELVGFLSIRDLMLYKIDYVQRSAEFLKRQVHLQSKPLPM